MTEHSRLAHLRLSAITVPCRLGVGGSGGGYCDEVAMGSFGVVFGEVVRWLAQSAERTRSVERAPANS